MIRLLEDPNPQHCKQVVPVPVTIQTKKILYARAFSFNYKDLYPLAKSNYRIWIYDNPIISLYEVVPVPIPVLKSYQIGGFSKKNNNPFYNLK